jgi:hypothetical protein
MVSIPMLFALTMVDNAQAAMVVAGNRRLILGNIAASQHAAKHDYDLGNRALEKSMPSCWLHDGQNMHMRHAQTARRANLPQGAALAPSGKSRASSRASRLGLEGRMRYRHETWGGDAMDVLVSPDERRRYGRGSRVVLASRR